jgi:phage terminase small subunit
MGEPPSHLPPDIAAIWLEFRDRAPRTGPDFEAWCGQVSRLRDAQRRIANEGLIVADARGNPIPHPALMVERQAQSELRNWGASFRLGGAPGGDPFGGLL